MAGSQRRISELDQRGGSPGRITGEDPRGGPQRRTTQGRTLSLCNLLKTGPYRGPDWCKYWGHGEPLISGLGTTFGS
jgi:hypothetical protein